MLPLPIHPHRATYRLQLTSQFRFEDAANLATYLSELGISDLYLSPIFQASSSSTHGYDVNDHNQISVELGGRSALEKLSATLTAQNLGLLVDFVPNHMGIDGEYNWRWRDVLENGAHSRYAPFFDIEWQPRLDRLKDRVLVPILGDHYGAVLERGELPVNYEGGRLFIQYGKFRLPLRPRSYGTVLELLAAKLPPRDSCTPELLSLARDFQTLPSDEPDPREKQFKTCRQRMATMISQDFELADLLRGVIKEINGKPRETASFETLHQLLEDQHYRLAYWRVGAHEVNYRRFFAVDTLVGLKMEEQTVFDAMHCLLGELVERRIVTGIRLDHIDGLWNPREYLERLERLVREKLPGDSPVYTLVEKILAVNEHLPESWAVHGTTGYEFCGDLINLFLDRSKEAPWTRIYGEFTGHQRSSADETYSDKLLVLDELFSNAVGNLASELDQLVEPNWHWRDISLHDLQSGLRHLLACLPVYRTYRESTGVMAANEREWIRIALDEAIRRNPRHDPAPLRFLASVIVGDFPPSAAPPETREAFASWVCKLQQTTGAVMAKSVEDTHFYRYVRMFAANEVGSHPSHFGEPIEKFHEVNAERGKATPLSLLATSTHDTKISEDARARLFALAELPDEWESHLRQWSKLNEGARTELGGKTVPEPREEYLLYQILLAAWPTRAKNADEAFRGRIKAYFQKALAEAKQNTTWTYPNKEWEEACGRFIDRILGEAPFLNGFVPFAERIAERGMYYSLAQTVLKLTCPGVPDIYQGNEVWDFSLVDPDNRRPVDFALRFTLMKGLNERSPADLLNNWHDGAVKMHVLRSILHLRREKPELFSVGNYSCLTLTGKLAEHAVAFTRCHGGDEVLVVVPCRLESSSGPQLGDAWIGTRLNVEPGRWRNILTGEVVDTTKPEAALPQILAHWPVAVLLRI